MKSKSIQLYIRIILLTKYPIAQTFRQEEELLFLSKNISLPNAAQSIMSSGIAAGLPTSSSWYWSWTKPFATNIENYD